MNSLVKTARISSQLSIEDAARKLNISEGYLSQIENGHRQISSTRAEEIANLYRKNKDDIFLPSRYAIREVNGQTTA